MQGNSTGMRTLLLGLVIVIGSAAAAFSGKQAARLSRIDQIKRKPATVASTGSAMVVGQSAGVTPLISQIHVTVTPPDSLKSVQFTIQPKAGSVTRPLSATYSANYLQSRTYLDTNTGDLFIPVFGLYPNFSNTVALNFVFTDNSTQQTNVMVTTADWTDSCNVYKNPVVLQARTAAPLSYDYFLIKNNCGTQSPIIMDTDGQVRWVGPSGSASFDSTFSLDGIYIMLPPPSGGTKNTELWRLDFDGIKTPIRDFSNIGVVQGHHNIDPGRDGMLIEVDTTGAVESVLIESDFFGNVLHTWNFATIISQAMTAGGDNPSQFVGTSTQDWFHMNAATYRRSDNTLVVSSRENFVIAVDYDTQQIKWILGDTNKHWHQFPSLAQYALILDANSLPPIGQHGISFTFEDKLLLFDDGFASSFQNPPGNSRTYSAPRQYRIDAQAMTATEIWNYPHGQTLYSPICSSIYRDGELDYLIDYSNLAAPGGPVVPSTNEIIGIDQTSATVFDYRYTNASGCTSGWNAIQTHLEAVRFTSVQPLRAVSRKTHGPAGPLDFNLPLSGGTGTECRNGDYQVVVRFASSITAVSGASVTPGSGGTASVSGSPSVSGNEVTVNLTNVSTLGDPE